MPQGLALPLPEWGNPKTARRLIVAMPQRTSWFISLDSSPRSVLAVSCASRHQLMIAHRGRSDAFYGLRHPGAFPLFAASFCTSTPRRLDWLRVCTDSPSFVPYPAGSVIPVLAHTRFIHPLILVFTCALRFLLRARHVSSSTSYSNLRLPLSTATTNIILIRWPLLPHTNHADSTLRHALLPLPTCVHRPGLLSPCSHSCTSVCGAPSR